ncbi:MAG TPA: hypothetical protein VFE42_36075 [Chloroflexota bacterium]|nr:hypothetical protein [Chloroflexota bacterium]
MAEMASELRVQVAAARRLSLPRGMAFAIGLALAMRVALSLIGAWLLSFETPAESPLVKQQLLGQVPLHDPWLAPWQRFDALWYTRIAAYGYRGDDVSTVYFPLYPLLIRAASTLLGGNIMLAGLVVSWLCFTALLVLLYRLVAQDHGESKARTTLLLLCAFPTASLLLGVYTESLYLALVVACFLAAKRRYGLAAVLGLLASFTRLQGLVLAAPLAYLAVKEWRGGHGSPRPWLAAAAPLLAVGAFQWYAHLVTRGVTVAAVYNRVWQQHFAPPWEVLAGYWSSMAANHFQLFSHATGNWIDALNLLLALGMLGLLLPARNIVGTPLWLYGLLTWAMTTSLHQSTARYMLTVFPALIVAAVRWPDTRLRRLALLIGFPLMLFMAGEFVLWSFIG